MSETNATDFNKTVGTSIKQAIKRSHVSRKQLLDMCGFCDSTLSNIIQGKTGITLENALSISAALNIPIEKLLGNSYEPPDMGEMGMDVLMEQHRMLSKAINEKAIGQKTRKSNLQKLMVLNSGADAEVLEQILKQLKRRRKHA